MYSYDGDLTDVSPGLVHVAGFSSTAEHPGRQGISVSRDRHVDEDAEEEDDDDSPQLVVAAEQSPNDDIIVAERMERQISGRSRSALVVASSE